MAQTSKGSSRTQGARLRAQARREAIARAERRRRYGLFGIGGVVALVIVLVIVLVVVNNDATKKGGANVTAAASAAVVSDITTIPASAYNTVGITGVGQTIDGMSPITGGTAVTTAGLPTFIYVGGEFCPYCAAERWAITAALSRFGTFTGLDTTRSAATDGNYATLSFVDAKYTSQYIAFSGTEQEDRARNALDTPPPAELASFEKYGKNSYPYVSIDNKYLTTVQYDASQLGTMTAEQIAAAVKDPTSTLGKSVLASANVLTAGICAVNGQKPAAVCSTSAVEAAGAYLNEQTSSGSGSSSG